MNTLLANLHQGCQLFQPVNGMQCTVIALVALLFFSSLKTRDYSSAVPGFNSNILHQIQETDLDNLLFEGSALYGQISSEYGVTGFLGHDHLPSSIGGHSENVEYVFDMFAGHTNPLEQTLIDCEFNLTPLTEGLYQAFTLSSFVLATFQETSLALYGNLESNTFYSIHMQEMLLVRSIQMVQQ